MEVVQPNSEMLAIARLYLEKRHELTEEERELYGQMLKFMLNPVIYMEVPSRDSR